MMRRSSASVLARCIFESMLDLPAGVPSGLSMPQRTSRSRCPRLPVSGDYALPYLDETAVGPEEYAETRELYTAPDGEKIFYLVVRPARRAWKERSEQGTEVRCACGFGTARSTV